MPAQPAMPLRPMTLGELLDAAMMLLRRRAVPLFATAAVLAAVEQVALALPRGAARMTGPFYGPAGGHFGDWWAVTALGFGLEGFVVTLLAAVAAAGVPSMVLGRALRTSVRPGLTVAVAVLFAVACALAAFLGLVPWIFVYGLFGMAAPALVVDRSGNAIGRAAALASREGMRGCWVLVSAYLTWFAIRFALGAGWTAVAALLAGGRVSRQAWLDPVAWGLANTVAYSALACVAAVLLVDVRVRTEGLDIAVGRARSRGEDPAARLVHTP